MIPYEDVRNTFAALVAIDSPSLEERRMADYIKESFRKIGIELQEDDSADKTGSTAGNLYAFIKGDVQGEPILFAAHMDTVMPAYGKKAIFEADGTVRSDGTTVLGADDLSGVTAIYEAVKYVKTSQLPHRDFEILFTTGEELYCKGAKAFQCEKLKARSAYVLDLSGRIGDAAYAAPTILSFHAVLQGKAAHAGFAPEEGINAIATAALAISELPQGRIDDRTTANIGTISGGKGINIVSEQCEVRGEIRSLEHVKAVELARHYQDVFQKSADKNGAVLKWEETVDIKAYETDLNSRAVIEYKEALQKAGVEPKLLTTFGGSDNNVLTQYGIDGIVIATSMNCVHSCKEYTNVHEIAKVAEILVHLIE